MPAHFLLNHLFLHKYSKAAYPIPERTVRYMNLDKVVCNCLDITNGIIKEAVDSGANTLEEVENITGVGTMCGACCDDVQHLIDFFIAERDK